MGMFDTFWGEYKCPECGNIVVFEKQTKDYERILEDFYLGDYIDRGNRNYFYEFETCCPKCCATNDISLAIRRGQYVGVYLKKEADTLDIMELENIEDGYQRNRIYDKMCEKGIGTETVKIEGKFEKKHIGDHITALRKKWEIIEVYTERLNERNHVGYRLLYRDNYVYRCKCEGAYRIIAMRYSGLNISVRISEDTFEQKDNWTDEEYETRYILQADCELVRLE